MEGESRIGEYRIDVEIAHSAICSIYRAHQESLDRPVLIKKLHPQMSREEDIRKRFEREAQVCARVKHENIVDIYSYQADADVTMLVMEFVEGKSLGDLITTRGRIEWPVALTMLAGLLKGLGHAHAKGVLHRDIKPDNLLVSETGMVKITDFGLASIADASKMTMQGAVVGTPAYLPPEQVSNGSYDQRGDLFSAGVTIYEALTGTSPFAGQSFSETLKKILNYTPPTASSLIPEVPPEFDQILARLLEKQPSKRYATAEQALEEVRKLAGQKGISLEPESVQKSLAVDEHLERPATPASSNGRDHPTGFNNWLIFGTVSLAALVYVLNINSDNLLTGTTPLASSLRQVINPQVASKFNPRETATDSTVGKPQVQRPVNEMDKPVKVVIPKEPQNSPATNPVITPATGPGLLDINCTPWGAVTVDNVSYGQTPLTKPIQLEAGQHVIAISNPKFPTPYVKTVKVAAGQTEVIVVDLWMQVGVIQIRSVKPWGEIFVDGVSYGMTPRAEPIIVPFGKHTLELRNGAYKLWKHEYELSPGSRTLEVSAALEPAG